MPVFVKIIKTLQAKDSFSTNIEGVKL